MNSIDQRLSDMGLQLPAPLVLPEGVRLPFRMVNVRGDRAFVSGHGPQNVDGTLAGPFGKVGCDVTAEEGYQLARKVALSMLGSLQRELGSLDRIAGWGRVFGMVNSAPGFVQQPRVINGFSDLVLALFGDECGAHARSAVGMAELPFGAGVAVEIEAEVLLRS
ncbi:RidA family protein [Parahaliea aestuarii]|uniref:RidA family protein n=1 Tax=Parahaliea aestuarii TaxID=1852021 RepID=A0A5C8ZUQ8_9GAMM|nr:RidA family protein [Parahaliea aestuarii]TXS91549.1 RidA family protein [Parahaliea aestuarii]